MRIVISTGLPVTFPDFFPVFPDLWIKLPANSTNQRQNDKHISKISDLKKSYQAESTDQQGVAVDLLIQLVTFFIRLKISMCA